MSRVQREGSQQRDPLSDATPSASHRGDVQGLRAVAVGLVVLGHAGVPWLSGGYVGVDVFFVISGFLITGILVREIRRTGRVSIPAFYARRARRILPAATVTLVAVAVAARFVLAADRLQDTLDHVTWAAFFGANVYSARAGSDYFAQGTSASPVMHFWSLAVEEQFYVLWPPVIALLLVVAREHRRRRRRPAHAVRPTSEQEVTARLRWLGFAILLLCAASLAWSVRRTQSQPTDAYYSVATRGWELGAGALLALTIERLARWPAPLKVVASWAGVAAIALAAVRFSGATPFPSHRAALPVAGAALVLLGGADGPRRGARWFLDRGPMRRIGDISFSLYLWHWPFLLLPSLYLVRDLTPLEKAAAVAAATATSVLSYHLVELPARRAKALTLHRGRSLLLWPAAVTTALVAVTLLQAPVEPPPSTSRLSADSDTAPAAPRGLGNGTVRATVPMRSLAEVRAAVRAAADMSRRDAALPERLMPSLADLRRDVARVPARCGADRDSDKVLTCVLGAPSAARTMLLMGDSHMGMWLHPIERAAKRNHWRIVTMAKAICWPFDVEVWRFDKDRRYSECVRWRERAFEEIARLAPPCASG